MDLAQLYDLAEENKIDVDYFPMRELVSVSIPGNIAIDVEKLENSLEEKVCLAHELGHCMTSSFYNIHNWLDLRGRHEYRANKWAIKKLIKLTDLKIAIKKGCTEIWQLAEYFDVPYEFMQKAIEHYKNIKY